jgi:hypothetical protein
MTARSKIYVFRDDRFAFGSDSWVSTAQLEAVAAVFCPSAPKDALRRDLIRLAVEGPGGLAEHFGVAAVFRVPGTDGFYVGVWGARKASRFRSAFRKAGMETWLIKAPNPGKLAWTYTTGRTRVYV